jgi:hypothetical protein
MAETAREQSRVKFEKLVCQAGISDDFERAEKNSEEYFDIEVNAAWWGWQAALSTQPQLGLLKRIQEVKRMCVCGGDGGKPTACCIALWKIQDELDPAEVQNETLPAPPAKLQEGN